MSLETQAADFVDAAEDVRTAVTQLPKVASSKDDFNSVTKAIQVLSNACHELSESLSECAHDALDNGQVDAYEAYVDIGDEIDRTSDSSRDIESELEYWADAESAGECEPHAGFFNRDRADLYANILVEYAKELRIDLDNFREN